MIKKEKVADYQKNWFQKALNQLIEGTILSSWITMGLHEKEKWIILQAKLNKLHSTVYSMKIPK